MIRLLWLLDGLGMGGAESLVVPFARTLDRTQYSLTVASLGKIEGEMVTGRLRDLGVPVVEFGAKNLRDRRTFRRVRDFLRDERIDLVHAHLTYSGIWSALLTRQTGIPSVVSLHVATSATRTLRPSLRHRLSTDLRDWLMRKILNRWATRVIMVSEALRQTYLKHGDLRPEKVQVVHNGIELDRFARDHAATRNRLEAEFNIPSAAPILVTVAVLRPGKGVEVLLEAARQIPDAHFLILGDGPLRTEWTALAASSGIADRIRWAGYRTDVDALLAGCDLFVHPSLDDAFPTVLLEAMAAALPILASQVGGIPEIVTPGETGIIVPPGSASSLATSINALLRERAQLPRMGERGRAVAMERFSTKAWVGRLERVYGEVLGSRS
jgi:glycosyltransferase involved in cell wall biosynthesis